MSSRNRTIAAVLAAVALVMGGAVFLGTSGSNEMAVPNNSQTSNVAQDVKDKPGRILGGKGLRQSGKDTQGKRDAKGSAVGPRDGSNADGSNAAGSGGNGNGHGGSGGDGYVAENVGGFSISGPATVTGASYDSMPYALPLNPAGPQETMVRWVEGWGVPPSNADNGTVYVLGHAWGTVPLVFNPISEVVTNSVNLDAEPELVEGTDGLPVSRYSSGVLDGSLITMEDADGNRINWSVTNSWLVKKDEAIADPDIMAEGIPGRIILIACSVSGSLDLGYNVVVEGYMV